MKNYNCLMELMLLKKITVKDLASATGISEITISRMRSNYDCKISTVIAIADYLNVSIDTLYKRENKNVLAELKDKIGSIDDPTDFYNYLLNYNRK